MCQFELDIFLGTTERAVEFNSTLDRQGLRWHYMKVKAHYVSGSDSSASIYD